MLSHHIHRKGRYMLYILWKAERDNALSTLLSYVRKGSTRWRNCDPVKLIPTILESDEKCEEVERYVVEIIKNKYEELREIDLWKAGRAV